MSEQTRLRRAIIKYRLTRDAWMDAPVKSDAWKNLYFLKDGRSVVGRDTYPSESDAFAGYLEWISLAHSFLKKNCATDGMVAGPGYKWPFSQMSHAIQIPVKV